MKLLRLPGVDVGTREVGIAMTEAEMSKVDLPGRMDFANAVKKEPLPHAERLAAYAGAGNVTRSLCATLVLLAVAMLGGACAPGSGATTEPSVAVVPIVLREAPPNLGCDSILPPYRSATIRIDALMAEQIWADADTGARLAVYWSRGYIGGTSLEPVVVDPEGRIIARDGERIVLSEAEWPRLHGYFVCPGTTALYVLLRDPE